MDNIEKREITAELREAYLDYAMSVIVSRALPDVRDGLKPVQRRILYAMHELGLTSSAKFRKCAKISGDTTGNYHPHGTVAVYDALARMAQDFSLRYPLVIGQGNFGCFTKDTKVKLADGRNLSFGELVNEHRAGKTNYTYTVNALGRIAMAKIEHPRMTKQNAELVKVVLDNEQEIRCTPNHRFMLRNGTYKEAQYLEAGDSLMPLYEKFSGKTDRAELVRQEISNNHKVVRVEQLSEREDVYDLTIEGTHNFCLAAGIFVHNSIDGDPPAAERYTEAKLSKIADELLIDIDKETVDWQQNFDGTRMEPKYFPAKLPNMLLNGAVGIAVGMATNIPPHNLMEVVDATMHVIENPDATAEDLMSFIKGPDFPTGGIIYDRKAINAAYVAGRGGITMRASAEIRERKGGKGEPIRRAQGERYDIEITDIPYQVNKSELITKMAELVTEKKIDGIRDIRDESDKDGLSIIIELKNEVPPQKVLNQLYQYTDLQKDFHLNLLALADGLQPQVMSIKDVITAYVAHRKNMVRKRAEFDLRKAEERAHILTGLVKALDDIDAVINTIKKSEDRNAAHANLMKKFKFSEIQANAILEMRLQTLAALEREKLEAELKEKKALIAELQLLLKSAAKILGVIKKELGELKEKYGDERRTKVVIGGLKEFRQEDLVPQQDVAITLSHGGYIKRVLPEAFRSQHRGGKGLIGSDVAEEDFLEHFISANTHDNILFFTDRGRVFQTKVYEIPEGSRTSKGKSVHNFLEIPPEEKISALIAYTNDDKGYLVMATVNGMIKKTALLDFGNVRRNGIIAIKLKKGDQLKWVMLSSGGDELLITTANGQGIRFKESQTRPMSRVAAGVRGIRLKGSDHVSGLEIVRKDTKDARLLTVMANGYGKQTKVSEYKSQNRGGSGVRAAKITSKTGPLISAHLVSDETELLALSAKGQIIRTSLESVRQAGRATQGVKVMSLNSGDHLIGVICL